MALSFPLQACGGDSGGDGTDPILVASVSVFPDSLDLAIGGSAQLTAVPAAAGGEPLLGRSVAWSSSNTTVATVSGAGLVSAAASGATIISATSEGVTGTAKIVVTGPSVVVVDSIIPSPAVEGSTATLHGVGFADSPAGNTVVIDGVVATVISATTTRLDIVVPESGCRPARQVAFDVSGAADQSGSFVHPLRPASFLSMEVGEQVILGGSDVRCLQFAEVAEAEGYLVGVQSTSGLVASLTPARLVATAGSGAAAPMLVGLGRESTDARPAVRIDAGVPDRWSRHRAAEVRLREAERRLQARMGARRAPPGMRSSGAPPAIPPDAGVGDIVAVRISDTSAAEGCETFFTVDAVVRVVGTHGIWLTDVTNPAGGYADADLAAMSATFDDVIHATETPYFGEPSDLDGNDRIAVLFSRRVNPTGFLGFVFAGDQLLTTAQCPSSNEAEVFYGMTPDSGGEFGIPYPLERAKREVSSLIAHEFAHILQVSNRVHVPFTWELEGQANFAEEIVGFVIQGLAGGNDYGLDVALSTDPNSIAWYEPHFTTLAYYFGWPGNADGPQITGAPEQCSWLGNPPNGPCLRASILKYDVAKSLLRYMTDQFGAMHAGGEQGLHRDLITSTVNGFAALEAITGVPFETILARWAASLYVDGRFEGMDPTLQWTTWNLFAIFDPFFDNAELHPRARAFADFSDDFSVRGGSTAYFMISGTGRPATALEAVSPSGAPLPTNVQMWIVRVQ